jgi:alkylated DNA repair dioxygenase AlkB
MSAQGSLFHDDRRILFEGEPGVLTYFPNALAGSTASQWFALLHEHVAWQTETRQMYDRQVDVPRLFARFDLQGHNLPAPIAEAAHVVSSTVGHAFNSVGLNLYRDESDSVAWHNDRLHRLQADAPIAILSLGATRRMSIRTKRTPRRTLHVDLESGSVLLMSYQTQLHLDHSIPKQREKSGPRISLAFRHLSAAARDLQHAQNDDPTY